MANPTRHGLVALLLGAALVAAACGGATPKPVNNAPVPAADTSFLYTAPEVGAAEAPVTIIEYGDYQ